MAAARLNGMALPGDIVFEVLKWCQYGSVISIRLVSKSCCEMTKHRLIWMFLARDYICGDDTTRMRRVVEHPIGSYSTSELESLVKLWASAERVWLNPSSASPLEPTLQFKLHSPFFGHYHDMTTSFLVPGGNFFIEFGVDASALYYHLDSSTPTPHILIPPVTGRFVQNLTIFRPYIDSDAEFLSFQTGVCFLDGQHDQWVVILWRIAVSSDGTSHQLQAEPTVSFFFEHPPHATLYMEAMDLSGNRTALYSSISPRAAGAEPPCRAVTLVTLSEVSNGTGDFKRRILYVDENFTDVNILSQQWLLVHSTTKTLLLRYRDSPAYTRTPVISEVFSGASARAIHDLRPNEYQHPVLEDAESMVSPVCITKRHRNCATYTTFQQTILVGLSNGKCMLWPMEITFDDDEPRSGAETPCVSVYDRIPSDLDYDGDCLKLLRPPRGVRAGLLEFIEEESKLNVYITRDDESLLTLSGSIRLGSLRRRGMIHSVDEGTARILMYDFKRSVVSVFDLVSRQ